MVLMYCWKHLAFGHCLRNLPWDYWPPATFANYADAAKATSLTHSWFFICLCEILVIILNFYFILYKIDNVVENYIMLFTSFVGEFLGYFAGLCSAFVFLPQTIKTIKDKNVSGLSLTSYIIYCVGMLAWILYGIYLASIQMIIFNLISLVFASIVLYMIIKQSLK